MLSQLHPVEVPDADPPSDLRQVHKRVKNLMKEDVPVFNFDLWCSRCSRQWPAANLSSSWTDTMTGLWSRHTGSLKGAKRASSWSCSNRPLSLCVCWSAGCYPSGPGSAISGENFKKLLVSCSSPLHMHVFMLPQSINHKYCWLSCLKALVEIGSLQRNDFSTFLNFDFRLFNLYPLRFLSSQLSTCGQLSYRTEHMRTLSSVRPSAGHTQFMRWGSSRGTEAFQKRKSGRFMLARGQMLNEKDSSLFAGKPTSWCRFWWTWLLACCSCPGSTGTITSACWPTRWSQRPT